MTVATGAAFAGDAAGAFAADGFASAAFGLAVGSLAGGALAPFWGAAVAVGFFAGMTGVAS